MKKKKLNKLRIRAYVVKEALQRELFNANILLHAAINTEKKSVVLCIHNSIGEGINIDQAIERLGGDGNMVRKIQIIPLLKGDPAIDTYLNAKQTL